MDIDQMWMKETVSTVMKMLCTSEHVQREAAQLCRADQAAHGQEGNENRQGLMAKVRRVAETSSGK